MKNGLLNDISDIMTRFFDLVNDVDENCHSVDIGVALEISRKLSSLEQKIYSTMNKRELTKFEAFAYEIYIYLERTFKKICKFSKMSSDEYCSIFVPSVQQFLNLMTVLENWQDNPNNGNGVSLVKVVPGTNCYGIIFYERTSNGEVMSAPLAPRIPIYICAFMGRFSFCVCDFNEKHRTVIEGRVNSDFDIYGLLPPTYRQDKYYLVEDYRV